MLLRIVVFSTLFVLSTSAILAQGSISGSVTAKDGEKLSFAVVRIDKSGLGCIADEQGRYLIENVPAGSWTVVASYLGFDPSTASVVVSTGEAKADFVLTETTSNNEVVVTGLVNPKSALESSISISSINASQIAESSPRSTAEIFRSIPGIRSEASAGEGNTNMTVRGVPIATGGSKFLLMQEDGLPVLQFGDIAFATADIFTRYDFSVARIEAVRGGSASTLASNSPAGIINLISKTGGMQGGSIASTVGVDYRSYRTDFEYGSPIGNNTTFHIGGFYRQGDGPRTANFTSSHGGQIKANLTKYFNRGYARVYFKHLNDHTPAYMPMPMIVSGTNANPTWSSVPGYDALHGTMQSPYLLNNIGTGADGQLRRSNVANGMNPVTTSVGTEFAFEVGDGWNVINRSRMSWNTGSFTAPFPASVDSAKNIVAGITAIPGYTLSYAGSGDTINNASTLNGNGLLMRMHLFDVDLNNFNNFTNDFNVSKQVGKAKINAGFYKAYQNISMSWVWNSYLTDVTDEGARPVNVSNADTSYTANGLIAYGVPAWGNCCHRNYDTSYDISAPYAGVEVKATDALTIDGSFRYDMGQVTGSYAGGNGQTKPMDVNGDGVISRVEENVATIDNASAKPVNYDYNYASYSVGANYLLNQSMALFARHSTGGRANADRLLFGSNILANGQAADGLSSDMVTQTELGYKMRKANYVLNVTAFNSVIEEQNYEATTRTNVNRTYTAMGLEVDGNVTYKALNLRGGLTFTDAEIAKDQINKAVEGNTPRRQAAVIYNFVPSVKFGKHVAGLSVIGTTKSYAQDDNKLVMPGYAYVNAFVNFNISGKLTLSVNGNNIFNQMGLTESEEGAIVEGRTNYVRARSIAGRTISTTLRFEF